MPQFNKLLSVNTGLTAYEFKVDCSHLYFDGTYSVESNIENRVLDISCPNCGHNIKVRVGDARCNLSIACHSCAKMFDLDPKYFLYLVSELR